MANPGFAVIAIILGGPPPAVQIAWFAVLTGALAVLLFFSVFIDAVWGRLVEGTNESRVFPRWLSDSGDELARGTVVMPELDVPDDYEPPSAAPPSVGETTS
jgi:hypothetical protein